MFVAETEAGAVAAVADYILDMTVAAAARKAVECILDTVAVVRKVVERILDTVAVVVRKVVVHIPDMAAVHTADTEDGCSLNKAARMAVCKLCLTEQTR